MPSARLRLDPRPLAIAALLIASAGCSEESEPEPAPVGWGVVGDALPGALISVTGTAGDDVWAVGGDPQDGSGPMVLHFDGASWRRLSTNVSADLWWVHALADGSLLMGGTEGTLLRYRNDVFEPMTTPSSATVFGIWAAAPDDVWAVGGTPTVPGNAFVWRYDGQAWSEASGLPATGVTSYFKVWGRSADDVRIVGADGVILHYDGQAFTQVKTDNMRRLLTVYAQPEGPYVAVGGGQSGVVLEDDGSGWRDVTPPDTRAMVGVRLAGSDGYAVGTAGAMLRRVDGAWQPEQLPFDVYQDFHAVWIDPDDGVWAVGGDILATPMTNGVLVHRGKAVPAIP